MKTSKKKILLLMVLISIYNGCVPNTESVECTPQLTGELQESETKLVGEWSLTSLVSDTALDLTKDDIDNPDVDIFNQYSECFRDAFFTFKSDRSYAYEKGTRILDCDDSTTNGTWKLTNNELFLIVSCGQLNYTLSFNDNNSEFVYTNLLEIPDVEGFITKVNVLFTYSRISTE